MSTQQARRWMVALAATGVLTAWVPTASADRSVDRKAACAADGRVTVSNVSGEIKVEAWDRNEVHVSGTLGDKVKELVIEEDDGDVDIEVELPRNMKGRGGDADLVIRVPKGATVEVETVSASITVSGVEGELALESVSGGIEVRTNARSAEVSTVSGAIDVRGKIGAVDAESVSGAIDLRETSGDADVSTTSGAIRIEGGDFRQVSCASVSGAIVFEGRPVGSGSFEFENFSGSVRLRLSADVDADFQVETFSGSIDTEFGGRVHREQYGPGASLELTTANGAADITVSTFSGSVRLEKD